MSTSTTELIGLEQLLPEPCDGTGEDAMSRRARRKWHVGVHAGQRTTDGAGLQAADYTSFGAWVRNRRWQDRQAQFLYALWQQSARPVLPKPRKALNRDSLASIASKMAEVQLSKAGRANGVVAACTTNQQFYDSILHQVQKCNKVTIYADSVLLDGPHLLLARRYPLDVNGDLFATLCGLGPLVFPEVQFGGGGVAESVVPMLSDIERLDLSHMWSEEHLKQLVEKNKGSLKVLKVHASMLSFLPDGLRLEEFSCTDPDEIPTLETKVFICKYIHKTFSLPPPFLRTVSADEIRIEARDIHQPDPTDTLAAKPASSRVKKLTIVLPPIELPNLASLFRDITAMCPQLECLELVQDSNFYNAGHDRLNVADQLAANIRGVMEERSAPFRVSLKMNVKFIARSWPVASDFARRLLNEDLLPHEYVAESTKPIRLVKEMSDGTKTLRVDCEIDVWQRS